MFLLTFYILWSIIVIRTRIRIIMKGGDNMSENLYKPGTDNLPRGEYKEVGPRGGEVKGGRQVTIDPGDRLPPTQEKGRKWKPI